MMRRGRSTCAKLGWHGRQWVSWSKQVGSKTTISDLSAGVVGSGASPAWLHPHRPWKRLARSERPRAGSMGLSWLTQGEQVLRDANQAPGWLHRELHSKKG